jgi:hypothetical protein
MNMKILYAIIVSLMMFMSCNNFKNNTEQTTELIELEDEDSTMTILEGVFTGIMPVYGIDENAVIWLFDDSTYQVQTLGQNPSDSLQIIFGDFFIDDSTYVIELMGVDSNYAYFMFATDSLVPLNSESMIPIEDPVKKAKFTLRKKKTVLPRFLGNLKK